MPIFPAELTLDEAYSLLTTLVQPRPIALVGSRSADGTNNIAPFSFFMLCGLNPPSVAFGPSLGAQGEDKGTLANVAATREFTLSLVDRDMAQAMFAASTPGGDKWEQSGLKPVQSTEIECVYPQEAPVTFECRVHEIVRQGEGPFGTVIVVGEVVSLHLREDIAANPAGIGPISRLDGRNYLDLASGERFVLG